MALGTDVPFAEMDVPEIARYVSERAEQETKEIREQLQELIPGLFDPSRKIVHQTIRSIAYFLEDQPKPKQITIE